MGHGCVWYVRNIAVKILAGSLNPATGVDFLGWQCGLSLCPRQVILLLMRAAWTSADAWQVGALGACMWAHAGTHVQ